MANSNIRIPSTLIPSNISESGYAIADARYIAGSKSVATVSDLYSIYDWLLSSSKTNENNDALGSLWFVQETSTFYYLKDWENRTNSDGWKEYKSTSSSGSISGTPNTIAVFDNDGEITSGGHIINATSQVSYNPNGIPTASVMQQYFGDGLRIKGTIGDNEADISELPTTDVRKGDAYIVSMYANTYADFNDILCETNDIIYCQSVEDDVITWNVIQGNLHVATSSKLGSLKIGAYASLTSGGYTSPLLLNNDNLGYVFIPVASDIKLGLIKIGYTDETEGTRKYGVELDESNKAFVNVPWVEYVEATDKESGLMSSSDKLKLDSLSSGISYTLWDNSKVNISY